MKKIISVLLAITLIFSLCACGSKTDDGEKVYTVAVVQPLSHTSLNQIRDTIVSELENSGMNIKVVTADANNDSSAFTTIVSNYKAEGVDLIVPIATPIATTAKTVFEGTNTPIVYAAITDPEAAGLTGVDNITGVSDFIPADTTVDFILEMMPECKKIGLLYTSSETNSVAAMKQIKDYCDSIGLAYEEATIGDLSELQTAAQSLVAKGIDAFYTNTDNTVASAMTAYTDIAYGANIPIFCGADSMVADGGFATVGVNYVQIGKQVADIVLDVLGGKQVSDIPYETLTNFTKFINLQAANTIGFDVTDAFSDYTVLVEADGTSHFGE